MRPDAANYAPKKLSFPVESGTAIMKAIQLFLKRSLRAAPREVWQSTIQNEITKIATRSLS